MPSDEDEIVRKTSDLLNLLHKWEQAIERVVSGVDAYRPEHSRRAHDAEWHVQGVIYHCRKMLERGNAVGSLIEERLNEGFERIITRAPQYQELLFEFYAMVNLSKIVLDELRVYLAALFVTRGLPKSVNDILKGTTDCPVYQKLGANKAFPYFYDIRTCVTHYRSLATGKMLVVLPEGEEMAGMIGGQFVDQIPAQVSYQKNTGDGYHFGIYLPDKVFEQGRGGEKLVKKFTFSQRIPLLIQSVIFVEMVVNAVGETLSLLRDQPKPLYTWSKQPKQSARSKGS